MTITTQQGRQAYMGDGSTVVFTVPFKFFQSSDLKVILQSASGVDTTLTENVHYTVTGAGNEAGGTVTMTTAPAAGETLTIILDPPRTQLTDYVSNDAFPAESHERALDRLTQQSIRTRDIVDRALRLPDGDASVMPTLPGAAARANMFLRFDASGNPEMATGIDQSQTLSQSVIGQFLYPQTPAEVSAGVTPVNYAYAPLPILDILRFLTPDESADNTTGLQNALDVADELGGAIIQLPPGATIRYDGNIDIPRYTTIRGCGWSSVLKPLSSNGLIRLDQGDNAIENLLLEGSVTTPGSYVGTGIVIGSSDFVGRIALRNLYIRHFQIGVRMRAALWTFLERCHIEFNRTGLDFDSLSSSHQNNDTNIISCVFAFNERQGIATSNAPIANRGLRIIGGSIEGNGDEDYETYAQCQLLNFSEIDVSTYIESVSTNKPDALTIEGCSGAIHDCSFIGCRDAIKDPTGGTTSLLRIHGNKGAQIANRALDIAGGTDNVAYSNSWGSHGAPNIFTGTRCKEYGNRFAEFRNEQTSFTPTLFGASTAGSPTYTIRSGFYSRIDNLVFIQGRVSVSNLGGMAGAVSIGGLPVAASNVTHAWAGIHVQIEGCTVSSGQTQFIGMIPVGTSQIDLYQQGGTASQVITAANLAASSTIIFSGWYVAG